MILGQVNSEEEGLALFFELFNNFKHMQIESLVSCVINQEHLDFHYNDKYSPRQSTGDKFDVSVPLYQNAQKIYYAELSDNIGFIGFAETEKSYELIQEIYKAKEDIIGYWQRCFGRSLDWQGQKYDNINFAVKQII